MRLIHYFDTWAIVWHGILFQYFWRFAQICKQLAAFERKIVLILFLSNFRTQIAKLSSNNKFLANLCKSLEILKQYDVKWWLVSYSFSCICSYCIVQTGLKLVQNWLNIIFSIFFYRLTQGFLLSSTQQILDRLAASTQDSIDALRKMNPELVSNSPEVSKAGELIREADNSKHLL